MNDLVKAAKAIADPTRLRIIAAVLEGELCVCELCDSLEVTQSTLSTHLQVIRDAGLVTARKEGKWMYYDVHPDRRTAIEIIFKAFRASLMADAVMRRDKQKLRKRLALRDDGVCCFGSKTGSCKEGIRQ